MEDHSTTIDQHAQAFFTRYPHFAELFSQLRVVHCTHGSVLPGIQQRGLVPDPALIPDEAKRFIFAMFDKYGRNDHFSRRWLDSHIFGKAGQPETDETRGSYLTATRGDAPQNRSAPNYRMPERIIFLLRELHSIATSDHVDERDAAEATRLFRHLSEPFLRADSHIIEITFDPMSPAIVNEIFHRERTSQFDGILSSGKVPGIEENEDPEQKLFDLMFSFPQELVISDVLPPTSITSLRTHPISAESLRGQCTAVGSVFAHLREPVAR